MDQPLPMGSAVTASQVVDRATFEAGIGGLVDGAYRLAAAMLQDTTEAEDAVQDAVVRAWSRVGQLRDAASLRPWFLAVVANECRRIRRQAWWRSVRPHLSATPVTPYAPDAGRSPEDGELREALRRLPHGQRLTVVLRHYLDMSVEETASVMGVPPGTVKSRLHRAHRALHAHLAGDVEVDT